MKTFILIALGALAAADPIDYYITDNTGLDIEALAAQPLKMISYINCFLDRGPCCREYNEFWKKYDPEHIYYDLLMKELEKYKPVSLPVLPIL
ncbi:hypothetical protein KGM_210415 [Danaus plexippus plexippus]|uniref:Chemosensory protein n=1 Tax=Danaus plexippus plexippus TaxID=278856 RepID=A0A212F0F3_DANPL|nr:hypothetical protein KGM_210415 [Danaus plexippus plexippus]